MLALFAGLTGGPDPHAQNLARMRVVRSRLYRRDGMREKLETAGWVAALLVAAATLVGLWFTHRSLDETTKANARASQSYDASIRPLIAPYQRHQSEFTFLEDKDCLKKPYNICLSQGGYAPGEWILSVPYRNIGLGFALITRIWTDGGTKQEPGATHPVNGGLASGAVDRMEFRFYDEDVYTSFTKFYIDYTDITGHQPQETRMFLTVSESYFYKVQYLPPLVR